MHFFDITQIGKTVLFYAVAEGDLNAIQKLIEAGCNVRDVDSVRELIPKFDHLK